MPTMAGVLAWALVCGAAAPAVVGGPSHSNRRGDAAAAAAPTADAAGSRRGGGADDSARDNNAPLPFTTTVVFTASHNGGSTPAGPLSTACQAHLDAFCNSEELNGPGCLDPSRKAFGNQSLPMVALYSATATDSTAEWRCFSHLGVIHRPFPHWNISLPPPSGYPGYCTEATELAKRYRQCSSATPEPTEKSYFGFRIPGIVYDAMHDTVMAFAQGMHSTCGFLDGPQQAPYPPLQEAQQKQQQQQRRPRASYGDLSGDLVLKRSTDGGKTFEPLQVVYNSSVHGQQGVWDPTPVYERKSGIVFVFFAISPIGDPDAHRKIWAYSASSDGGLTWRYRDVSKDCNPTSHVDTAFCGGHGTQLSNGRLLVPTYNSPGFSACFSTDYGRSWSTEGSVPYKTPTPDYNPAEAEIVELFPGLDEEEDEQQQQQQQQQQQDEEEGRGDRLTGEATRTTGGGGTVAGGGNGGNGSAPMIQLLANLRYDGAMTGAAACGEGVPHCRWFATSTDLGLTWGNGTAVPQIPDPSCKGGIGSWVRGKALVAVNSDSLSDDRVNCTVYLSKDNGRSWPQKLQVSSDCGYSTVAVLERGGLEETATAAIMNLFDTTNSASDDGCRDIRVALVDPTHAL